MAKQVLQIEEGMDPDLAEELLEEFASITKNDREIFKVADDGDPKPIRVLAGSYGPKGKAFYRKQIQHWAPDPTGKSKFNIPHTCAKYQDNRDEHCPFCEAREVWKSKEDACHTQLNTASSDESRRKIEKVLKVIEKMVNALNYRTSYALNVVPVGEIPKKTKVFFAPKTVFQPILRQYAKHTSIFDPQEGHNFNITRRTENRQTKYETDIELKPGPISNDPDEIDRLMKARRDLDKEVTFRSPEEMEQSCRLLISEIAGSSAVAKTKSANVEKVVIHDSAPSTVEQIPDEDDQIPDIEVPSVQLDEREGDEIPPERTKTEPKPKVENKVENKVETDDDLDEVLKELAALEGDLD